jgi:hypothetical protein
MRFIKSAFVVILLLTGMVVDAQSVKYEGLMVINIKSAQNSSHNKTIKIYFHSGMACVDSIDDKGQTMKVIVSLSDGICDMLLPGDQKIGVKIKPADLNSFLDKASKNDISDLSDGLIRVVKTNNTKVIDGFPCYEVKVYGKSKSDNEEDLGLMMWMADKAPLQLNDLSKLLDTLKLEIHAIGEIASDIKETPPNFFSSFPMLILTPADKTDKNGKYDEIRISFYKQAPPEAMFDETGYKFMSFQDASGH